PDRDLHLGAQAEADVVAVLRKLPGERRAAQLDEHLRARRRQGLPRANEERHAPPAPGVDGQPPGAEGRPLGARRHTGLLAIAAELAAHEIVGTERPDAAQHLRLLVADRVAVTQRRRLHGQEPDHLQHVILDDVADRPGLIVEATASLYAETL